MKKTLSFALALCAGMLAAGELRIDLDSMKSGVNLEIKKTSPANFIVIDSPWYKENRSRDSNSAAKHSMNGNPIPSPLFRRKTAL